MLWCGEQLLWPPVHPLLLCAWKQVVQYGLKQEAMAMAGLQWRGVIWQTRLNNWEQWLNKWGNLIVRCLNHPVTTEVILLIIYRIFRTISRGFFLAMVAGQLILLCDLYADKFISMPLNLGQKPLGYWLTAVSQWVALMDQSHALCRQQTKSLWVGGT